MRYLDYMQCTQDDLVILLHDNHHCTMGESLWSIGRLTSVSQKELCSIFKKYFEDSEEIVFS